MKSALSRSFALSLSLVLAAPWSAWAQAPGGLRIIPVAGEGAINNIEKRVVIEPVVEVQDEQGRPVVGARVEFRCPTSGPSATFFGASPSTTVETGEDGRARAAGMSPNAEQGTYRIAVTATHQGRTTTFEMTQTNAVAPDAPKAKRGIGWRLLAAIGAGVAAGVVAAARRSDDDQATPTTISVGGVTVGEPR